MRLINISNHDPKNWSEDQKAGWSQIDHIAFPNIPSAMPTSEIEGIACEVLEQVEKILGIKSSALAWAGLKDVAICVQGEFTLTTMLAVEFNKYVPIVFPTTERTVVEKDGVKTSVFKFVQWRMMERSLL